jgi:4-diphosphocytidyl-2-C-methyl-D-erythritol kinase
MTPRAPLPLLALAPAKVNLCLYVGGRRDDGLHEICSLFQSLTLADRVLMEEAGERDEVVCACVPEPNLATAALSAFRERLAWRAPPLRITIEKAIPVAAGLAGGSADAAAVIRLALAASGIEASPRELTELAMSLGADVPSQLSSGMHLVSGAGEHVARLDPPLSPGFLLLTSHEGLSTGDVYSRADELGLPPRDLDLLAEELRGAVLEIADMPSALGALMHSDLQRAAISLEPSIEQALELLRSAGAAGALVSGSGPTAFGVFPDLESADRARERVAPQWRGDTIAAGAADSAYAEPRAAASS